MDGKNNLVELLEASRPFLAFAEESFLVTLANKGLYKRAVKDCDAVSDWKAEPAENGLTIAFEDVIVTLDRNIAKSKCSCPSKTVCKHVLMAVLHAAELARQTAAPEQATAEIQENTQTEIPAEAPFQELKSIDLISLKKQAGKRLFEDTARLVREGWAAEFAEGEMLAASINTENITVYFPKQHSVSQSVCKCGEPGLCRHKLIAILSYLEQNGLLTPEEGGSVSLLEPETLTLLQSAKGYVSSVLEKGVICCGEGDVQAAAQFSVRLEGAGIGNLARLFRSLSTDFENLLAKNVAFQASVTFSTLSRLYNTLALLVKNPQDSGMLSALVENSRSEYFTTPSGSFIGLGAYPWQTRSGFFGVTAYLYHCEKKRLCTYSVSMADFYENTEHYSSLMHLNSQYLHGEHWQSGVSLKTISTSRMVLGSFKSNLQNRISSGKQTLCEITGKTTMDLIAGLLSSPDEEEDPYSYFQKRQPEKLYGIYGKEMNRTQFDKTEQTLYFRLEDPDGKRWSCGVPYSDLNEAAVKALEQLGRYNYSPRWFLCRRMRNYFQPVAMVTESGVKNFYFTE